MTPAQRQRVREIFEAAFDRDAVERSSWAAREAGDDPVIRDEVLSLLDHHDRAGAFLSQPIIERVPDLLADDAVVMPGTTLGAYTIVRELGRGGMGRVYLASDARLGRQVALKVLAPHLTRDPVHRERLRREARAAAGLTHPGICAVYALEETDDDLFIVSEYVDGVTLRDEIVSGRRPSATEIVRTARDIAAALAVAHARGIVHRDLKPENIMRARDGRLKILDFGLARFESVPASQQSRTFATEPGVLIGTPAYMAPEQLNGGAIDVRADVFAFGAVIYEYICGVHPFAASTPLAIIARVLESEAQPLVYQCPQAPVAVLDCVERCLRKAPSQRFDSGADLVLALDRAEVPVGRRASIVWWRTHQLVIIGMYLVMAALGWQIKEWVRVPATALLFIGLGVGAAIGGVLRGHLVFTEHFNRQHLAGERHRASAALTIVDVLLGMALVADGMMLVVWPLTAVLTMSLGVGMALAVLVLEPATTRAVLGDG